MVMVVTSQPAALDYQVQGIPVRASYKFFFGGPFLYITSYQKVVCVHFHPIKSEMPSLAKISIYYTILILIATTVFIFLLV